MFDIPVFPLFIVILLAIGAFMYFTGRTPPNKDSNGGAGGSGGRPDGKTNLK